MNKTIKRNVLVSAILAIMLCVSLIAGATFALFTSESKVNIAVTSGKVSVTATIDQNSVETKQLYDTAYKAGVNNMYEGVATFNEDGLTLEKFVPGDGIKFNIVVKNESNVTVKYRTIISCENDNGLFAGLNITIDEEKYNNAKVVSNWEELTVGSNDAIVPVEIELPETADNEYQEKTCTISYKVEAIQGNASVVSVDANGKTTAEKEVEDANGNKAIVSVGTAVKNGEIGLSIKVKELDETIADNVQTGYFELKDGNTAYAFNVNIPEVDENNETPIVVTMNTEKNLTDVVLFHKGDVMTEVASTADVDEHHEFYYDAVNGKITFATKNFSNFTLVSGLENVAFVGSEEELRLALENSEIEEIVFKNNINLSSTISNDYGVTGIVAEGKVINGNGYILKSKGSWNTWDSVIYVKSGTIKNLTVTNAMRGIFMGVATDDVIIDNVIFSNVIYTFNSDGGSRDYSVRIQNSILYGWTSFSDVHKEVVFENCVFAAGNGYNYSRPYNYVSYVNCTFEEGHTLDTGSLGEKAEVILYECNYNGVAITEENVETLDFITNLSKVSFGDVVNSGDELQDAINNGEGNIILGGDIDLNEGGLVIP